MKRMLSLLALLLPLSAIYPQKLVDTGGYGYAANSVNTAIFRTNSLVTHKDSQYLAFWDGDGYLVLGKRGVDSEKWTLCVTQHRGNVKDAHNVISLMVDGEGYLHVAFDHHDTPLRYCRGVRPGSLILGEPELMTGQDEDRVTYPGFYRLPDGDLIFTYRSGASGRGNLVMNRYDTASKKWERLHNILIDGEEERSAYWQMFVDKKGSIHLSWVWRETWDVATNHDLCYARSDDGGVSWIKSNGDPYRLPITAENAEYAWLIPMGSELINQTSMSADRKGNPYIAGYWRDQGSDIPQYRLVWFDGIRWQQQQVAERKTPFSLSGGGTKMIPISRPQLAIDEKRGRKIIYYLFRDVEHGSKVSLAKNVTGTKSDWEVIDLTDFSVDAWEPSFDTELWKEKQKLHIYVQRSSQGDGEKSTDLEPQPLYLLEYE